MKKSLLLIAAFAMSTLLFAQKSDVEKMEAAVAKIMDDATTANSDTQPKPVMEEKNDTNDSEKKVPSEEK